MLSLWPSIKKGLSKQTLLIVWLLVIIILPSGCDIQKAVRRFQSPSVQVLKSVNIQKLTVYKLSFEVITRVRETEEGDISLQFLSGGLLGKESTTEILYRGCLEMRYGIDIPELTDQYYQLDADPIKITLPPPRVIGSPQFVTTADCATGVIDTRTDTWFSDPSTRHIVKYTRIKLQENLPEWLRRYGFDEKVRERTEQIIKGLFESLFPDREFSLSFDDAESESPA